MSAGAGRRPAGRGPSGRDLARPRTHAEAVAYLVSLVALYGGIVALLVLDAVGPTCTGATCANYHPGARWALGVAAWGFLGLVVLAFRFTRRLDREVRGGHGRASSRGWPLAWNYLAAGLMVPTAVRVLRGAAPGG